MHFRGSKTYKEFREALLKDNAYSWLVVDLDKTDVTSVSASTGPIKGWYFKYSSYAGFL